MNVSLVKEAARQWVIEDGSKSPDFMGAYLVGSITHLPDNFDLPTSSDVDIAVRLAQPNPENKPTKFLYRDVLIEVNYPPWSDINSPEVVLGEYRRVGGFRPGHSF